MFPENPFNSAFEFDFDQSIISLAGSEATREAFLEMILPMMILAMLLLLMQNLIMPIKPSLEL